MKRDLVIGAITGYKFEQILPWVNSLDRSGFEGIKAVVAYNIDSNTIRQLNQRGYATVILGQDEGNGNFVYPKKDFAIVVDRFLRYYLALSNKENERAIRNVIATDVKDVIFQHNPSTYLDTLGSRGFKLVTSSEAIAYQHEPWGANNLLQSFGPEMYVRHEQNIIVNCGVIAGEFETFIGLCKTIYLVASGTVQHVPGGGGPDQAALNLIIQTPAYKNITDFANHEHPWAAQLGTTMDPNKINAYNPNIKELKPVYNFQTGMVETPSGMPYSIVHQWDRVPMVKHAVEKLYL